MSQRDSGYERIERDIYETPEWVTEALVPHLPRKVRNVLEPAMGSGKITRALSAMGISCDGSDIRSGEDFLVMGTPGLMDSIITNPPYTLATEFCEHALHLMVPCHGLVAMLLRTDFDHAKGRAHLFSECPAFAKKVVLRKRITWFEPPKGAKGKSPSFNHAWFIWDWQHKGAPTLAYGP